MKMSLHILRLEYSYLCQCYCSLYGHFLFSKDSHLVFMFLCSVDDGFPTVTFHFEDSLSLTVYPHEYLFDIDVSETNFEVGLELL